MISTEQLHGLPGSTATDSTGDTIGSIRQVYLDDHTGQPSWATVTTQSPGNPEVFIPLHDAQIDEQGVNFPYTTAAIAAAPHIDTGRHLDAQQEVELSRYYGVHMGDAVAAPPGAITHPLPVDHPGGVPQTDAQGGAVPIADEAGVMIAREEQLHTTTRRRASRRVRFRKVIVTEEKTLTVSVRREELRVEQMNITDDGFTDEAAAPVQNDHTIVLHEEVPVLTLQTRPFEAVHISIERVTGQQRVTDQIRAEHIKVDDGTSNTPTG
ncbi:YsnF/AvaK domain-containing protein [Allobranchiibius sp. GilTou73]|uniref:YsnF/AvaK domain-containing protein n=1 Tax=Allobranchiibius sp. GilTou73 TaxID=2904523 RepID=UPI001F1DFFD5|nr:YsnF/AvaK domain-containing protein [Allobranchiibius sp. GilTou73]UIJ35612.1 YsnF/AvaK domain-containing protein [Allobranchiibius sp. GilTou73]